MKDQSLRVLMVEDSENDALLLIRVLKKGGYHSVYERVETATAMKKALQEMPWDIVLCDYSLPKFNALSAIALLKEANMDIPLIVVTGTVGEETAIECMRRGAKDYIMKSKMARLCPAIARELKEAKAGRKQKQAELQRVTALEELRKSEEKHLAIIENIEEGYYESDLKGNLTFFNSSMCQLLGYAREELIGINSRQFTDKENAKKLFKTFYEVYKTGNPAKEFDWQVIRKDGTIRHIEASVSQLKDSSGKPIGFRGIVRDTTERKLSEEKLQQTLEILKKEVNTAIHVLATALEFRDPYTAGHQSRSADLARAIATEMELPRNKIDGIRMAGSIHDIGKLSIPAEILSKPTKLTNLEFSLIKEHSRNGYTMLKDVESPWPLAEMVYQHHERMNGTGYPRNLKDNEILLEARIMAVADVMEAMASHRPYRPSLGMQAAFEEIEKNRGVLYDSAVVDSCLRVFRQKGYEFQYRNIH